MNFITNKSQHYTKFHLNCLHTVRNNWHRSFCFFQWWEWQKTKKPESRGSRTAEGLWWDPGATPLKLEILLSSREFKKMKGPESRGLRAEGGLWRGSGAAPLKLEIILHLIKKKTPTTFHIRQLAIKVSVGYWVFVSIYIFFYMSKLI